ncbi:MAG: hypothetical protein ACPGUD_08425 [Parashewanella sp.]
MSMSTTSIANVPDACLLTSSSSESQVSESHDPSLSTPHVDEIDLPQQPEEENSLPVGGERDAVNFHRNDEAKIKEVLMSGGTSGASASNKTQPVQSTVPDAGMSNKEMEAGVYKASDASRCRNRIILGATVTLGGEVLNAGVFAGLSYVIEVDAALVLGVCIGFAIPFVVVLVIALLGNR